MIETIIVYTSDKERMDLWDDHKIVDCIIEVEFKK